MTRTDKALATGQASPAVILYVAEQESWELSDRGWKLLVPVRPSPKLEIVKARLLTYVKGREKWPRDRYGRDGPQYRIRGYARAEVTVGVDNEDLKRAAKKPRGVTA